MAFAFRQLWYRADFSYARGDLVPVPAAVCRVVTDCVRNHAGGCVGGNWFWRNGGWRDFSLFGSTESIAAGFVAGNGDFGSFVVSVFPRRIDSRADWRVRSAVVADRADVCRIDVPRRVALGNPV